MLHLIDAEGSYSPETIVVMTAAFDAACQYAAKQVAGNDDARQELASIILRHIDAGESDPARLAVLASSELIGRNGSAQK